ncbi:MAG: hypothetical protein FJ044_00900 [Candidatus Cloacimonetes bacterium]|nr:hypothetical protein [Candidatus Cloacimonadota bacterium]
MEWGVFAIGLALAGLVTLIFRWVKNKVPKEKKGWKWLRKLFEIAFVIWLLVVTICIARYLLDPWERAVAIHQLRPVANWLEVGWACVLRGPEKIEAAKEQLAHLPQVVILPPPPVAPTAVPAVTLEELRRRELPIIPLEIRSVTAAEIETFSATKVITEGIPATMPMTATVTVQVFKDGTVFVSNKSITETVAGAGGWLFRIRKKAEDANVLDVAGRLPKQDYTRVELAQAMSQMRVVLEFSGVTTNPAAEYGPAFMETEKLVDRLLVLPVAVGKYKFNIAQAPRGATEGGTSQLQALVSALRRQYYELSSRHRTLADQVALGKVKIDGRERKALLTDAQDLLWTVRDLKSKLSVEMDVNGTGYETVLLQWLNATELDLVALTTRI